MRLVLTLAAALAAAAPSQDNPEARLRAGQAALAAREYHAAQQHFQAVLIADPANPTAHLNLGIIALIEGDPANGLRHFSRVAGDPRALIGRLDCELRLGILSDARNTAKQLETMIAGNAAANEHVGKLLTKAGEYATAAPFLRRATGAAAAYLLGSVEEKTGNLPAAVKAFGDAAGLEPGNEDYRIDYAAVLLNAGRLDESVAAFHSAARDFPQSVRIRLGLGSALYLAGRHEAAAQALLEAVRLEPTVRGFDLLGKAYEAAGGLQPQIRAEFEKYLNSNPRDAAAYAHFGSMLYANGNPARAQQALERALTLDPDLAAAHLQLGIMEQAAGRWSSALERYLCAAELDPVNASVHYRLATVYGKLGNRDKARAALAEFRRLKAKESAVRD